MRMMSFAQTTEQFRNRTKSVTRRLGWRSLDRGTLIMAVVKSQGLKKGESPERLGAIRIVSVRREPLQAITKEEVSREGFPGMEPHEFVDFFCKSMGCEWSDMVTRIEFEYVDEVTR